MSYHAPDPDARTLVCRACGRACEPRANGWEHVRARCLAYMPRLGERCMRTLGHRHEHRSGWDLQSRRERQMRLYGQRAAA